MYQDLLEKKKDAGSNRGSVMLGFPLRLNLPKIKVIGFDINAERVDMMRRGIDPSQELAPEAFENCDIEFTNDLDVLRKASFI